jgi:hypothetical protein
MNQTFDFQRSIAILKLSLLTNKKAILLAIGGFFGFVFITSFFIANGNPQHLTRMHVVFYIILLFGGVTLAAGRSFRHMNSPAKSIASLSLPASTFEKVLIPWLLTGIVWALLSISSYLLIANLINGLWAVVFSFPFETFNPFTLPNQMGNSILEVYLPYFIIHSVFFLGAASFQKNPIPKTLLTGFLVNSTFTFVGLITIMILFGGMMGFGTTMDQAEIMNADFQYVFEERIPAIIKSIVVYVLPVIFYIAAFFKIKEREV